MAFSLTPKGGKAVFGVLSVAALTDVDPDSHVVVINDLKIQHTNFPLWIQSGCQNGSVGASFLPATVTISLERILACTPKKESAPAVQLKNDPPVIFVSYKPAILLDVDGEPVHVPIQNTNLEYVKNTTWRLVRDKANSRYYYLL